MRRTATSNSLLELDIEFFDASQTGALVGRLSEDLPVVRETYVDKFLLIVQLLSQAVIGLFLALFTASRVCRRFRLRESLSSLASWRSGGCGIGSTSARRRVHRRRRK
jgi:ABC-type multidrug transport system fused ATPase/permease subunit